MNVIVPRGLAAVLLAVAPLAQAQLYVCTDARGDLAGARLLAPE